MGERDSNTPLNRGSTDCPLLGLDEHRMFRNITNLVSMELEDCPLLTVSSHCLIPWPEIEPFRWCKFSIGFSPTVWNYIPRRRSSVALQDTNQPATNGLLASYFQPGD